MLSLPLFSLALSLLLSLGTARVRPSGVFVFYPRDQDERYHPPPAVLPREGVVVVALGPFKALVHTEGCLLFEAGKMDVSHVSPILADLVRANNEVRSAPREEKRNINRHYPARTMRRLLEFSRNFRGGTHVRVWLACWGRASRGGVEILCKLCRV